MSAAFQCLNCKFYREATAIDYIKSDYWPGSLGSTSYLFDSSLLRLLFHLKHKTPGTSVNKFCETLNEISTDYGRVMIRETPFNLTTNN